jgi:chemotaxis response regulator CheB
LQSIRKEGIVIRAFLVCDDRFLCDTIRDFLNSESDFQVCGESTFSLAAVQQAHKLWPDVIILIVVELDNLGFIHIFKQDLQDLPLFLITKTLNLELEREALSDGVDAVFWADDDLRSITTNARALSH